MIFFKKHRVAFKGDIHEAVSLLCLPLENNILMLVYLRLVLLFLTFFFNPVEMS